VVTFPLAKLAAQPAPLAEPPAGPTTTAAEEPHPAGESVCLEPRSAAERLSEPARAGFAPHQLPSPSPAALGHPDKPQHKSRLCSSARPAEIQPADPYPLAAPGRADEAREGAEPAHPANSTYMVNGCVGLDMEGLNAYLAQVRACLPGPAPAAPIQPAPRTCLAASTQNA
jgi:hypothetical protein